LEGSSDLKSDAHQLREAYPLIPFTLTLTPNKVDPLVLGHTLGGYGEFRYQVEQSDGKLQIAHIGGAGNKCLHVALGNIDSYLSGYLDFWDLCAGDVIARAQGCYSTNELGKLLKYEEHPKYKTALSFSVIVRNKKYSEYLNTLIDFSEF